MQGRPYVDADMPRLLGTFAGWIAEAGCCGYDHPGELPHRIYENLHGQRPAGDLVQLWEGGGQIAGLAICLRFGAAFDVFAAPSLRGRAAERQMLQAAYATTARFMAGSSEPFVLTDVFSCDTVRAGLLAGMGYEHFRTWCNLSERDLRGPLDDPAPGPGFVLRSARLADAGQLAEARNHSFGTGWTGQQYRSAVMEKPGYDPAREIVAEAPGGQVVAFAVYWIDERNRTGHFEPVGTHRGFQRRGLARAVMLYAMRQMQNRGMTRVTVGYDATNLAAHRLYESAGFVKRYQTLGFRRPRPAS